MQRRSRWCQFRHVTKAFASAATAAIWILATAIRFPNSFAATAVTPATAVSFAIAATAGLSNLAPATTECRSDGQTTNGVAHGAGETANHQRQIDRSRRKTHD